MEATATLVTLLVSAAHALHQAVLRATWNEARSHRLWLRVNALIPPLQHLSSCQMEPLYPTLRLLLHCVDCAVQLVGELSSADSLRRLLRSGEYEGRFLEVNRRLSGLVGDLHLGLALHQLFDPKEDETDRTRDWSELRDKQEELLQQLCEQERRQCLREGHQQQWMQQRMDSVKSAFKAEVQRLVEAPQPQSPSTPQPPVTAVNPPSTFRVIPFHELRIDSTRKLGGGGFGDVYPALWLPFDVEVAVKVLRCFTLDGEMRQDFLRELQTMHELRGYEHVVTLLGACVEEGSYCIVMEHLTNGSLWSALRKGWHLQWDWPTRCRLGYECVKAVNFLHRQHPRPVLHQDIKSLNFLLDHHLRVKVRRSAQTYSRHLSATITPSRHQRGCTSHL